MAWYRKISNGYVISIRFIEKMSCHLWQVQLLGLHGRNISLSAITTSSASTEEAITGSPLCRGERFRNCCSVMPELWSLFIPVRAVFQSTSTLHLWVLLTLRSYLLYFFPLSLIKTIQHFLLESMPDILKRSSMGSPILRATTLLARPADMTLTSSLASAHSTESC